MSAVGAALATGSPHAPRLDPLRSALAKFDPAPRKLTPEPPLPKTPPARGGKPARR